MKRQWDADVDLSPELAATLIAAQFPDLAGLPLVQIGVGFDNAAYQAGEWLFRFPRRAVAVPLLETEIRCLARLAPRLSLAVPVPERVGRPAEGFPYPFAGYRMLPGVTGCSAGLERHHRAALAPRLGAFLREIHSLEPIDVPRDPFRKTDLGVRGPRLLAALAELPDLDSAPVRAEIADLSRTPPGPERLIHGDFYARHLLLEAGRLTGVIDWGDLCTADVALDLAILFTFVPVEARPAFLAAYGDVDPDTLRRARFHAWRYVTAFLAYSRSTGDPGMGRLAAWALDGLVVL